MSYTVPQIAKAVIATVVAGAAAIGTALTDGHITGTEWCVIVPAIVVAAGAVFSVPNADKPAA